MPTIWRLTQKGGGMNIPAVLGVVVPILYVAVAECYKWC
jgi:hypothetical protein